VDNCGEYKNVGVAWDIWEFRNDAFHRQQNISIEADSQAINLQIEELTDTLTITGLLPKDHHLLDIPYTRLISLPRIQKTE
jgi:hypothetical protein